MRSILDHFGVIAPFYDRIFGKNRKMDWASALCTSVGHRILDVGGGTGRVVAGLPDLGCQVFVVDESQAMLHQAKCKKGLKPVCAQAEHLPFVDSVFDRVIMVDAMHHVADQFQSAAEMVRVLKSDGMIVLREPDICRLGVKFVALAEKLLFMRSHFLNAQQIANLFMASGAQVQVEHHEWEIVITVRKKNDNRF